MNPTNSPAPREAVITRIFDAPRELVFKLWTDPKHLAQWWGPRDFTNPVCEIDLRPGGTFLIHMRAPDGTIYPDKGVFQEIVEPERLVFTTSAFEDEAGEPQLAAINTVTFIEENGKTKLTLHAVVTKATPDVQWALSGMEQGWTESFDKLADNLKAIQGENSMTNSDSSQPDAALKRLGEVLVGTWEVSGGAEGQISYEWMDGGFFLIQRVELDHDGHKNNGIEIIGRERGFETNQPSEDIKSRFYGSGGETFDYVYELDGDTLTIWGGAKGSPAYYQGKFSADGTILSGGWVWPGGGYESTSTRVK